MEEAISREEKILSGEQLEPISREEHYLAKMGGQDVETPEPISRKEHFYQDIIDKGGIAGGSGDGTPIVTENITITPTTSEQVKTRSSGKYINKVTVKGVTSAIDNNIQADNIKKDVTILGVTGTLETDVAEPNLTIKSITANGTYKASEDGADGYKEVTVNVQTKVIEPTGTINITENGTHNVKDYASASVNVPIPEGYIKPEGNLEITENDTYDIADKKTVTVNVAGSGGSGEDMLQARVDEGGKCDYLFYQYAGSSVDYIKNLDTSKSTSFINMFLQAKITTLPAIDTSNATSVANMFRDCSELVEVPALDTSNVTAVTYLFYNCRKLVTVGGVDLINVTSTDSMFSWNVELKNLILKNIKATLLIGTGTTYGHQLTVDSLIGLFKELWNYSGSGKTYKLTIGTNNTAKLTDVYVKLITPTTEQIAQDPYIENKLPCEVCNSTDDGAMTIMDYASSKGWTIG